MNNSEVKVDYDELLRQVIKNCIKWTKAQYKHCIIVNVTIGFKCIRKIFGDDNDIIIIM